MTADDRRQKDRRNKKGSVSVDRRATERRRQERRNEVRVPLELWMEEVSGEDVYFRRTGNISEGGVFFDKAIPHPLGTTVTLKFVLPGQREMVVARGEVVSSNAEGPGLGMSVKFVSIEGDGKERVRQYIKNS